MIQIEIEIYDSLSLFFVYHDQIISREYEQLLDLLITINLAEDIYYSRLKP